MLNVQKKISKKSQPQTKTTAKKPKKIKKKKRAKILARAKTNFPNDRSQENRVFNIKKAAKTLNNMVIQPGEEFSFEKVYSLSHVNGKFRCTRDSNTQKIIYAGGISQVCTTLFQAIKKAKLPVTERHNFKHKVFYSTPEKAAIFRKGEANFRFRNLKSFPIKIKATVVKNCIKIKILKMKKPKN